MKSKLTMIKIKNILEVPRFLNIYRKIPNVSPGLIEVLSTFWGAYIRGAYIRRAFCVSVRVSRP